MKDYFEHARFMIDRFDHYYDSVNNKGNFFLAFNTFILGITVVAYKELKPLITNCGLQWSFSFFIVLLVFSAIGSIIYASKAVVPFLGKNYIPKSSLIFFSDIAKVNEANFIQTFQKQTDEEMAKDYAQQIHQLSLGLEKKFMLMKRAGYFIWGEILFVVLIVCIIIFGV